MQTSSTSPTTFENVTWGYAENMCQRMDPRAHLLKFQDVSGFSVFKSVAQ